MKNRIRLPQLTAESCAVGWEHICGSAKVISLNRKPVSEYGTVGQLQSGLCRRLGNMIAGTR